MRMRPDLTMINKRRKFSNWNWCTLETKTALFTSGTYTKPILSIGSIPISLSVKKLIALSIDIEIKKVQL
jgi:hypothetical protein